MTYLQIITAAAKAAKTSAVLLYAMCAHESMDFNFDYTQYDGNSPSYSVCQIKEKTSRQLGFKGEAMELRNPHVGISYAAKYLRYQLDRYGNNWCKAVAAYNSGTFIESSKKPGLPKNLKYVHLVQEKLPKDLQRKLSCDINNNRFIDKIEE